jgi:hypothetical protein
MEEGASVGGITKRSLRFWGRVNTYIYLYVYMDAAVFIALSHVPQLVNYVLSGMYAEDVCKESEVPHLAKEFEAGVVERWGGGPGKKKSATKKRHGSIHASNSLQETLDALRRATSGSDFVDSAVRVVVCSIDGNCHKVDIVEDMLTHPVVVVHVNGCQGRFVAYETHVHGGLYVLFAAVLHPPEPCTPVSICEAHGQWSLYSGKNRKPKALHNIDDVIQRDVSLLFYKRVHQSSTSTSISSSNPPSWWGTMGTAGAGAGAGAGAPAGAGAGAGAGAEAGAGAG